MKASTIALRPFFFKTTLLVLVLSELVNLLLLVAGRILSAPPPSFGPYQLWPVMGLTALGVAAAAVVYVFTHRYFGDTAKANRWFVFGAIVVLIASFYPDLALPWSTDPDQIGWTYGIMANLMLMHVACAGFVVYFFTRHVK